MRSHFGRALVVFCVLWGVVPRANAFYIHLHGIVTEHFSGDAMKGVQIRLVKDSIDRETIITSGNGKYELYLERGYNYQVWFHRADLVTKHVAIDAREVPLFPDVPFYDMDLQMTLFTWLDGFAFDIFDAPVGKAEYKHSVRNLNWDIDYTRELQPRVERVMVHYEREVDARARKQATAAATAKRNRRKRVDF
ncbi:MAG TPA: hypothetical protein PLB89_16695 [Flavobacteriales bacterium]|nr:hypothetical protein [Flavobacteriales bacterium]